MIAYEHLAALPGAVALAPASVWIASIGLAVLAVVIVVRLCRERESPVNRGTGVREYTFLPGILCSADKNGGPEKSGEKRNPENLPRENRSRCSREHLP